MRFVRTQLAAAVVAGLAVVSQPQIIAKDAEALSLARQLNKAFIEVAESVSPSVVVITVTQKSNAEETEAFQRYFRFMPPEMFEGEMQPRQGMGSGIIVRDEGYILTNSHVVDKADKIRVRLSDGREFDAEVRGTYPTADIAVIKLKEKVDKLTVAKLADSDKVRVGEFAIAIGAPFELDYSVTFGHVSAKGRGNLTGGPELQDFIQTDASINFGNSGGPLVNLDGEVIGINSMIRGVGTGIGFAIPSNVAHEIGDHIITNGKFTPSWLGIGMAQQQQMHAFKEANDGTVDGVLVQSIRPDGPASRSKLEPGDIITKVDGRSVTSGQQLKAEVARKTPGKETTLEVVRDGKTVKVKVTPEPMPENLTANFPRSGGKSRGIVPANDGLTLKALTPDLAKEYGVDVSEGVVVTDVDETSLGARLGFQPGDVITEVNGESVSSPKEFRQALKGSKSSGAKVKYLRDGARSMLLYKLRSE